MTRFCTFISFIICHIGIFNTNVFCSKTDFSQYDNQIILNKIKFDNDIRYKIDDFLKSSLTKPDYERYLVCASQLSLQDLKIYCSIVFNKVKDITNLDEQEYLFLNSLECTTNELVDSQIVSFNTNEEFRSPVKTMRGQRVVVTTPEMRAMKVNRAGIKVLNDAELLRSSRNMRKRRLEFNAQDKQCSDFLENHKRKKHQEIIDADLFCGLTRLQTIQQKELLQQSATINAMQAIVDLNYTHLENNNKTISRDAVKNYFILNFGSLFERIDVKIHSYNKQFKSLHLYFNPQDFSNLTFSRSYEGALEKLRNGDNPTGFQIHHLTMSQRDGDILIYLPICLHKPEIHLWRTDINEIDRADFNQSRKAINRAVYTALQK